MTLMDEYARRRIALAIQDETLRSVTRREHAQLHGVTPSAETLQTAAEGRAGGAGEGPAGQKIAKKPAGARAPETAAAARVENPDTEIPEDLRTKPNRRENEFMLNLMVLRNTMHKNAPELRERARLAGKWVWRDIRILTRLVDKVQEALLKTMPASRDEYYSAYARHGHYELHIDGPIRTARHLLITDKHLAAMAEAAMKSECILCMREGSEIRQCPLREALLETAAPTDLQEGRWEKCEYRDAAGALVQGKDVTV